ncbi:MAG: hypothetical protein AB1553_08425 [Nitrospirota bacterium]
MKYMYAIVLVVVLSALLFIYQLTAQRPSTEKAVLIINDRVITADEYREAFAAKPPYIDGTDEFINEWITKELLIQEAERRGISKEESFRRSVQNFYEQSLIKLLMDRTFASLPIAVSDDEIKRYQELANATLRLTILTSDSEEAAKRGSFVKEEITTVQFNDLSRQMLSLVLSLKEGEQTGPVHLNRTVTVIRLDRVERKGDAAPVPSEAEARALLTELKKERLITEWMEGLKKRATIKILLQNERRG